MEIQFQETLEARKAHVLSEENEFYRFSSSDESITEDNSTDEEIWKDEDGPPPNTTENQSNPATEEVNDPTAKTIIGAISLFILLWQACYGVPGSAISVILKFLKKLTGALADLSCSKVMKKIADSFPISLATVRELLGAKCNDFTVYAACPKCYALYSKEHCTKILPDGRVVTKTCSNVLWPNHPQVQRRDPCREKLMKKVRGKSGSIFWYPRKVYVYRSLFSSLNKFIFKDTFFEMCNQWRNKHESNDEYPELADIHDGKVWKEFQIYEGRPFLKDRNNLALVMNVDWFNPFKHAPGSVGAVYCVFANLPREERYKRENVLLLGLIEGEPKHDLNSILKPAIDELLKLWDGHVFRQNLKYFFVRVALLCIACDVPAARKVAGFMAHNARRGCSRCLKEFPVKSFGEKPDFSGFDRNTWPKRNSESHRRDANKTLKATSSSQRKKLESTLGVRYTELLRLPYYDCVRFVVIDPMHNLLLGTAKCLFHKWIELGLLKQDDLNKIQNHINEIVVPPDIGRIPNKIESGSSGMTADQWKNWTLVYSPYILSTVLPKAHYDCWMIFVAACRLMCGRTISRHELKQADKMLIQFCKTVESLYSKEFITPNMHLHGHLVECIEDFGPVYAFWCFSFERYNGILGGFQHNNKAVPVQMMKRFLEEDYLSTKSTVTGEFPMFTEHFANLCVSEDNHLSGTLQQIFNGSFRRKVHLANVNPRDVSWTQDVNTQEAYLPLKTKCMDEADRMDLTEMYKTILPHEEEQCEIYVSPSYLQVERMKIYGEIYDSSVCKSPRANHITASWFHNNGISLDSDSHFRPAKVRFFIKHTLELKYISGETRYQTYLLACVSWFQSHDQKNYFPSPLEVWCRSVFEDSSPATFLPVGRIMGRFCPIEGKLPIVGDQHENVLVVNPLQQKWAAE